MKQLFLNVNSGEIETIETPAPVLKNGTVLVESLYTIVSAGTERMLTNFGSKNLIQKAMERPDQVKKITDKISTDGLLTTIDAAFLKLNEPMPLGYSGVGKVISVSRDITDITPGDIVAMAGTAYHSEVNRVGKNLICKVSENFPDIRQAAFCALGGIALEGIHQAKVMPGETVAVIGMGLVGQITARILNAYGCDVIGIDISDKSMAGTRLRDFILSNDDNASDKVMALTKGRGTDKVIIAASTESNDPVDLAAAIARDRAIICMIGVTQMNLDRRPMYKKELTFTIARSYGPGRYDVNYEEKGIDLPIGYVRFSEGRNLEEFIRLIGEKRLDISDLITHEIPFEEASRAYDLINGKIPERYIGILLKYSENSEKLDNKIIFNKPIAAISHEKINVGLIGGGNFARSTMLPCMQKSGLFHFHALATTGGVSGPEISQLFHFDYSSNNYQDLLNDSEIDLIAIGTRHNMHTKFIIDALNAGKNVYCEKPLCLSSKELLMIKEAYKNSAGELFCGLNRRHAPLIQEIKKRLQTNKIPAIYDYIMNAGYIPADNWVQDPEIGGGRIMGESCHIVDVLQFLDGSELLDIQLTEAKNDAYPQKDNVLLTLKFKSGAVGNIVYTSMGSKKYPKEQLRVFSNGSVAEMNNFINLIIYGSQKTSKHELRQDKGIVNEYCIYADIIKNKKQNTLIQDAFTGQSLLLRALEESTN